MKRYLNSFYGSKPGIKSPTYKVKMQKRDTGKALYLIEYYKRTLKHCDKMINSPDTDVFVKAYYEDLRNSCIAGIKRIEEYLSNEEHTN